MKNEYDILTVFAIMLVVLGHITNHYHTAPVSWVTSVIYTFHMPLFIAISGAIYAIGCEHGKYREFAPFLINKFRRLLVPFLSVGLFVLVPTLVLCGISGGGMLSTGCDLLRGGTACRHLWYLESLFEIFLMVWCLDKLRLTLWMKIVISLLAFAVVEFLGIKNEWLNIVMALEFLPYFLLGILLVRYRSIADCKLLCLSFVMILIGYVFSKAIPNYAISQTIRIIYRGGIVTALVSLARMIMPRLRVANTLWGFVLKQSFGIYLFHMTFLYAMRRVLGESLHWSVMISISFVAAVVGSMMVTCLLRKVGLKKVVGE